jgi:hypothetical protein
MVAAAAAPKIEYNGDPFDVALRLRPCSWFPPGSKPWSRNPALPIVTFA